jgi:L-amino acid N-acyltransferase YncA
MSAIAVEQRRPKIAARQEMKIRDAVESDLPAIIKIYNAAVATRVATAQLEQVTLEDRRDWLKEHSADQHPFWVLEIDRNIAGWLTLKPFLPRCAYRGTAEVSVYVDEKFRRRGAGRTLLAEAISRAPSLQIRAMVGLIFAHNEPSLRLFGQLGFEKWGLLPRVAQLDDVERDLTIMGRHVQAS